MAVRDRFTSLKDQINKVYSGSQSGVVGYIVAIFAIGAFFFLSVVFKNESEALFALLYLMATVLIAIFWGRGAGILAGILASLSVDYHYIGPHGGIFDTWESVTFMLLTLLLVQLALFGIQLLQSSARDTEQAKDKLEAAVNAREEILRVVAHDLKQPLSVFSLRQQLALRCLNNGQTEKVASLLNESKLALTRMEGLIQELLDGSKVEAGTLTLSIESADLKEITRVMCTDFNRQAENKNIRLSFSAPAEKLPPVQIDVHRIQRVLSNLLSNAIKFTPRGGEIEVSVQRLQEYLEVRVKDSGTGVHKESEKNLFKKHWQETATAHLGTGLGLYICKGIIAAHKGALWYERAAGTGSTFCFRIPVLPEAAEIKFQPSL
jgi:signal transduction histidine kinase